MTFGTHNVWATPQPVGNNVVRQLLVPKAEDLEAVADPDGDLRLTNSVGVWEASRGSRSGAEHLVAQLPVVGDRGRVRWAGPITSTGPAAVLASFRKAIDYHQSEEAGLRRAQVGALHAIIGYETSGQTAPAVVVMPTGTGKTETMLAWLVATQPDRVLVIVPSMHLRDQLAQRFETLGILQRNGIVANTALRPCVARLEHALATAEEAYLLFRACNVIVATPHVLAASTPAARDELLRGASHLIVDEAHHAPAPMWQSILAGFEGRPSILFTATPYRSDARPLPGRMIYRFPLREAQRDGVYSQFDFAMVPTLDDEDTDLAQASLARLRADRSEGLDHVLLARVDTKARAEEVAALYRSLAPDLNPQFLHDGLARKRHDRILQSLHDGLCQVIVCVDMLGEGFDLPTLKVAAIHNPRRSLSPMVQLIGRMARTQAATPVGRASVFIKQEIQYGHSPIRDLLREDADWNALLNDVTEHETTRSEDLSLFNASFTPTPVSVPAALLQPKMSAVAFRTPATTWDPDNARALFAGRVLDDIVSVSLLGNVAWFVLETVTDARWGKIPELSTVTYDLVAMYLDTDHGVLFVYGSDTKKKYLDLATAVLGAEPSQIRGLSTFRVFDGLDRIVPTNVGLLDTRDRDKRFSLYAGASVLDALTEAEKQNKSNTHVAASALEDGNRVSVNAAMSGRLWSIETAPSLAEWRNWCHRQAAKLTNDSISAHLLFKDMLIPESVTARPPHPLLAVEWPWDLYLGSGTSLRLTYAGATHSILDVSFEVDDFGETGPFRFSLVSSSWRCSYVADVTVQGVRFAPQADDATVETQRGENLTLAKWLSAHKPTLILAGDRLISAGDRIYEPRTDLAPYDRTKLTRLSWDGVDIRVESQGITRRTDSIQAYMSQYIQTQVDLDILIDDDRSGEAADLVGLKIDGDQLHVMLIHCKYSQADIPGARLADLYEVCGQVMRGARWRDHNAEPLLTHLDRRTKSAVRQGWQPFEVGDPQVLHKVREKARYLRPRFRNIIAQPGLSISACSDEQLRLIAGAESYVRAVTKGSFEVFGSD